MRFLIGLVTGAALVAAAWIVSLPNRTECLASGRVVDPTGRHCRSPGGFQQLQEHVLFHTAEVLAGVAILVAGALIVHRFRRRRSRATGSTE